MARLQELLAQQTQIINQQQITSAASLGLLSGEAYSQYFPTWEVTTPQYIQPQAYSLSQLGYRTNEVAYACIGLKMKAVAEPPLKIFDENDEEVENDDFYKFIQEPCPGVSETEFHEANMMYLDIAGFMGWEKNTSNDGSLLNIWPMMPQYCSFMRGEGQLLRAIRYLPYTGLPAYDIDRNRIVFMSYVDPLYYGLKPLSPTAILADVIGVDNDMTKMLQKFITNGAFVSALLKTDQVLQQADADIAQQRFQEAKGGPSNAGKALVLGKGIEYQPMGQTFREMVFPEVDARSETRICMAYSVPPILVSAKSGMDRATYSNYEQARSAWYEEFVTSQWKFLARAYTRDLLPHFDKNPKHKLAFDITDVKALSGIREKQNRWIVDEAKANLITRDEARIELGYEKIDDEPIFVGVTTQQQLQEVQDVFEVGGGNSDNVNQGQETAYAVNEKQKQDQLDLQKQKLEKANGKEKIDEEKTFHKFAERRIKEHKFEDIPQYEFKYLDPERQKELIEYYQASIMIRQLEISLGENKNGNHNL